MHILSSIFLFFLKPSILVPLYLFSGVEEAMEGVAPVDQSAEGRPKGIFTILLFLLHVHLIFPNLLLPILLQLSHFTVLLLQFLLSPVLLIFLLKWNIFHFLFLYLLLSSFFQAILPLHLLSAPLPFSTITSPTITSLSGQDVSHSVPLSRPTPILGSFSIPSPLNLYLWMYFLLYPVL